MPAVSALGRRGEAFACAYFLEQGFEILDQNWYCRVGELDLVVYGQGIVHFIEVKARASEVFGAIEESISLKKREKLAKSVDCWLQAHPERRGNYQLDAFLIVFRQDTPIFSWIQGI